VQKYLGKIQLVVCAPTLQATDKILIPAAKINKKTSLNLFHVNNIDETIKFDIMKYFLQLLT